MQKLTKIINEFGCAILDGALATELERSGIKLHKTLWSAYCLIDNPQAIETVHYNVFHYSIPYYYHYFSILKLVLIYVQLHLIKYQKKVLKK